MPDEHEVRVVGVARVELLAAPGASCGTGCTTSSRSSRSRPCPRGRASVSVSPSSVVDRELRYVLAGEVALLRVARVGRCRPGCASTTENATSTTTTPSAIHRAGCFTPSPRSRSTRLGRGRRVREARRPVGGTRRRCGISAIAVPMATSAPPIQIHTTIGLIATPRVTRPRSFGDDTKVRYTSRNSPVRTDGVAMPVVSPGKVEIAGAYDTEVVGRPVRCGRCAFTGVLLVAARRARCPRYVTRVAGDGRRLALGAAGPRPWS